MTSTLAVMPALLWVYLGLGLPWALAALPRKDWADRLTVLTLGFAFGPMLLTAWMFVLGTLSASGGPPLLRLDLILAGTLAMAVGGAAIAWRKRIPPVSDKGEASLAPTNRNTLAFDEKLLIGLITAALILRWLSIAFWPFTAYDALWVFGYEGRLYALTGMIPNSVGYYPQFMPLQYTFAQLAAGGINDHAARAVLIFTHVGSILATFTLGKRLFNRRVGLLAAALWALYPHVGEWARFGDLEIPVTFLFTVAAVFFLMAWTQTAYRRRYALIAGLVFGAAMWAKPTAGAFIWGVLLLLAVDLVRRRFDWQAWRPHLEVALITGAASIPLGAIWYLRNALLGHDPLIFPTSFWLTQAMRSGREFGWPLLALLALLAYIYLGPLKSRPSLRGGLMGLALVLAGLLPSILDPHRMGIFEWALLAAGVMVLYRTLKPALVPAGEANPAPTEMPGMVGKLGWALLLVLPYFATWFYSYSYHYRLSFTIVPLLLLPTPVIFGHWLTVERIRAWTRSARWLYGTVLVLIALPGVVSTLYDEGAGWDWLWSGRLTDDTAKYTTGNAALMWVVDGLQKYIDEHPDDSLVVAAPGIVRLPFFFPLEDIRVEDAPTRWDQLAGVTYFIDSSPEGRGAYGGIPMQENQVISGLALAGSTIQNVVRKAWWKDDGFFNYVVYELHLDKRFDDPHNLHDPQQPVIFGDAIRFRGYGLGADSFWPGRPVYLQLYWQAVADIPADYTIYIHLRDADGNVKATWDGPVSNSRDGRYYSTLLWEPGEFIRDERLLKFDENDLPPLREDYRLVIGFYDLQTNERLPVTIGGQPAGDGYRLDEHLKVVAQEP